MIPSIFAMPSLDASTASASDYWPSGWVLCRSCSTRARKTTGSARTWIRWAVTILVVCFISFLVWELRRRSPLVQLRVFRNRNFSLGCILIGIFGGVIYGIITLLPLLYQELLGYNALDAGMAVSPRGLGSIVALPLIGLISSRIDNRYLLVLGFGIFGLCGLWFAKVNLDISRWSFLWPVILSGAGASMVFVPLASTQHGRLTQRGDRQCRRASSTSCATLAAPSESPS